MIPDRSRLAAAASALALTLALLLVLLDEGTAKTLSVLQLVGLALLAVALALPPRIRR